MDLTPYIGTAQIGAAYRFMLDHDVHPSGSVDRVLWSRMVRLCDATAGHLYASYTPTSVHYQRGMRPRLENYVCHAMGNAHAVEERVESIAFFCAALAAKAAEEDIDGEFGGREEEILARHTDWCVDLTRAACALYQVAGYPARLAFLADTVRAYSGHQIVEVGGAPWTPRWESSTGRLKGLPHRFANWSGIRIVFGPTFATGRHGTRAPTSSGSLAS